MSKPRRKRADRRASTGGREGRGEEHRLAAGGALARGDKIFPALRERIVSIGGKPLLRALPLIAIALAALVLRAARTDLMEFKHDEVVAWLRSRAFLYGLEFPRAGLWTSKGIENFPFFLYVLAAFQILFRRPETLVWPIAFLNSIAVFVIHEAVKRLFDRRVALICCLLYAVSPCAALSSRKLWAQHLLPFWASAMFLCATLLATEEETRTRKRAQFFFALLAVTSLQLHLSSLYLIAAYLVFFISRNRSLRTPWPAVFGAALGALATLPYIFYQAGKWRTSLAMFRRCAFGDLSFQPKALIAFFLQQVSDGAQQDLLGNDYPAFVFSLVGYNQLKYLLCALILVGLVRAIALCFRGEPRARPSHRLALAVTVLPLAAIAANRVPLLISYFIISYPMPFCLAAIALALPWSVRRLPPWLRAGGMAAAGVMVAAIAVYQTAYDVKFLGKIAAEGGSRSVYGASYSETEKAAQLILSDGGRAESLSIVDLNVLAACVPLCSVPGRQWAPPRGERDPEQRGQYAVVNRLLYPALDPNTQKAVFGTTKAYYCLYGPQPDMIKVMMAYPSVALGETQVAEQYHAGMLGLWFLSRSKQTRIVAAPRA